MHVSLASLRFHKEKELQAVRERLEALPLPTRIAVPECLAGYEVKAGQARGYDFLLKGGMV
jgi:hypothetical protein